MRFIHVKLCRLTNSAYYNTPAHVEVNPAHTCADVG